MKIDNVQTYIAISDENSNYFKISAKTIRGMERILRVTILSKNALQDLLKLFIP